MRVLEHQRGGWFLLGDEDRLLLDVACEHHAVGYSVLVELSAEERAAYLAGGRGYVDGLAREISDSAPRSRGSLSRFRERDVTPLHGEKVHGAIMAWLRRSAGDDPS